ncbi:MAG: hypothetical protein ACLFTT_18505 [Candidatus Hydrogenedentota bacterium]
MHEVMVWMGERFSPEAYLFWTRIQCLLWTGADLVIVYYLTRMANLARGLVNETPHRVPYFVLVVTAALAPLVAIVPTGMQVFALELMITMPHFICIVYLMAANLRHAPQALAQLLKETHSPDRPA